MAITYSDTELSVFTKIAEAAGDLQMPCYVIGGFVRDKLLGRKTKDADIVCVGDGIALAHAVAKSSVRPPRSAILRILAPPN